MWAVDELFDGKVMARESLILSQSYYYGWSKANRERDHHAVIVAGGYVDVVLAEALQRPDPCDVVVCKPKLKAQLTTEIKRVARMLAFVRNDDVEWKEWCDFGLAIYGATGGDDDGFLLFDAWSQRSLKYNVAYTRKTWAGFQRSPPNRIGAGTVFYFASKHSPGWDERLDEGDADAHDIVDDFFKLAGIARHG